MGRKPNALILQHFTRGAKLNDSSNRYEHTCKSCGERFPKGRIDSLTTHLIKKCPAISTPDRRKALLELNNIPDHADPTRARGGQIQMNGPATMDWTRGEDANNTNSDFSGLHALVEATQFDILQKHDERGVNNKSAGHGSSSSEPARLEILELYTSDNPPVSYDQRGQRDRKVLDKSIRRESEASLQPATFTFHAPGSRDTSPSLAFSASNMAAVATAAARYIPPMVDPQLFVNETHPEPEDPKVEQEPVYPANPNSSPFQSSPDQQANWGIMDGIPVNHIYSPAHDHSEHGYITPDMSSSPVHGPHPPLMQQPMNMIAEYGNGRKTSKPKVRSRFESGRRKQVQRVRKIGACLRCRMLKKPCGEGTPCETCTSVSSARVWSWPCTRVNISDLCEMFSAGLHVALSHEAIVQAKSKAQFGDELYLIDISHFPDTNKYTTINSVQGQEIPPAGNIDPGLNEGVTAKTRRLFHDDLQPKLDSYAGMMLITFISRETSHFMHVTLDTALQRSADNDALALALELWVTVHILVDSSTPWVMSVRSSDLVAPGKGDPIDKNAGDHSYEDLCGQLNAAAEKKAAQMLKEVLSDFEKRLLSRGKTPPFDFFLIAIIILNSVEKMQWLFLAWQQTKFDATYPLPKDQMEYIAQGENLAKTIYMEMDVRSVLPKTYVKGDGIVATDGVLESDIPFVQWFNLVQLKYEDIVYMNNFFPDDWRCFQLKLISQLFHPVPANEAQPGHKQS